MKKVLIAGLLGGIVLFVWTAISWMGIRPFIMDVKPLPNADVVLEQFADAESGLYMHPTEEMEGWEEAYASGPRITFMVFHPDGKDPFAPSMFIYGLILNIIAASIVAYILALACEATVRLVRYGTRVNFVVLFGVFLSVMADLTNLNYWDFPAELVFLNVFDNIITWALVGSVLAWRIQPPK